MKGEQKDITGNPVGGKMLSCNLYTHWFNLLYELLFQYVTNLLKVNILLLSFYYFHQREDLKYYKQKVFEMETSMNFYSLMFDIYGFSSELKV